MARGSHWLLRLGSLVLVGVLALAGCGAATEDSKEPSAGSGVPDPVLAAYGKLLDKEGRLTRGSALRVYAAAVRPLPGIDPAPLGDDAARFVGSALRVLGQDLDALAPAVRTEVDATLAEVAGPDDDSSEQVAVEIVPATQASGGNGAPMAFVPATVPGADELAAQVAEIVTDFEARSGHTFSNRIRVRVMPHPPGGHPSATDHGSRCVIALPQEMYADSDTVSHTSTLAHEVWHCFQFDASSASPPEWIFEGQAEWAGEAHVGGSTSSAGNWDTWLLTNSNSLYRRSYDAIGIYAVAAQGGADPWRVMLPMFGQGGTRALATLFGSDAPAALRATAEALTREPALGANWESTGPGITGAENSPVVTIREGSRDGTRIDTGPFGTMSVNLDVAAGDVLRLETQGGDVASVELQGLDAMPMPGAGTLTLCLKDGGCACPDGSSPGGGDALPQARPGPGAAAIGSLRASHVLIRGHLESIEEACEEDPVTGRWHAPVSQVWDQLQSAHGGLDAMECDGDYYLTLAEEGTWQVQYAATCRFMDKVGRGRARLGGTYVVEDQTLVFTHTSGSGTLTMGGISQPLPGLDGMGRSIAGTGNYTIEGDQMTVRTRIPNGATVTINWTRVG